MGPVPGKVGCGSSGQSLSHTHSGGVGVEVDAPQPTHLLPQLCH